MRLILTLCLLTLATNLFAVPASHRKGPPKISVVNQLVGHWHSTALTGGEVGLAVESVTIHFQGDKKFSATVNLTIGGPNLYEGEYHAKEKALILHPVSHSAIPCTLSFDGARKMKVFATESGVHVDFDRGEAPASSGGWF